MKNNFFLVFFLLFSFLYFPSCSTDDDINSITLRNEAMGKILFNFRGSITEVNSGETKRVRNIPRGEYTYSTTYEIPSFAVSSSAEGAVSGTLIFQAGTRLMLLYSSYFDEGDYIISATLSSSDRDDKDPIP